MRALSSSHRREELLSTEQVLQKVGHKYSGKSVTTSPVLPGFSATLVTGVLEAAEREKESRTDEVKDDSDSQL